MSNKKSAVIKATNKRVQVVRTISLKEGVRFKDEFGNYYKIHELLFLL